MTTKYCVYEYIYTINLTEGSMIAPLRVIIKPISSEGASFIETTIKPVCYGQT